MQKRLLTDKERLLCVARWLNILYAGFLCRKEVPLKGGCNGCPQREICMSDLTNWPTEYKEWAIIPVAYNFSILEKFTGPGTVISMFPNDEIFDGLVRVLHRKEGMPDESQE